MEKVKQILGTLVFFLSNNIPGPKGKRLLFSFFCVNKDFLFFKKGQMEKRRVTVLCKLVLWEVNSIHNVLIHVRLPNTWAKRRSFVYIYAVKCKKKKLYQGIIESRSPVVFLITTIEKKSKISIVEK